MNAQRSFPSVPLVKLGTSFTKVKDFLSRFQSIPDCLELDSLTVSGDVTFGKGVSLRVSSIENRRIFRCYFRCLLSLKGHGDHHC